MIPTIHGTRRFTAFLIATTILLSLTVLGAEQESHPAEPARQLQDGFRAMYAFDFARANRQFADYVDHHPDDPFGYAAKAASTLFSELYRVGALDAELYVDDKHLLAETKATPDAAVKRQLMDLTSTARRLAGEALAHDAKNENALFALAVANGLEADYTFMIERNRRAAAKPGRAGYDYAKQLIALNPGYYDAYIWTGVTNYVVASLPFPIRWLAKLGGYPGSKETAISDLRSAADKGSLLRPYARILLATTFLREKKKDEAKKLLEELSREFPDNPIFTKHARRLAR